MNTAFTLALLRVRAFRLADLAREDGQGVTEYGIVLAFVAVALGAVLLVLGGQISTFIGNVANDLSSLPGSFS